MLTQKLGFRFLITSPILVAIHTIKQKMDMVTLHKKWKQTTHSYSIRRYEVVGSITTKIGVMFENIWFMKF
jgi:hypothetical protein